MPHVELIYSTDCPNVKDARSVLLRAFAEAGLQPHWTEWDREAAESPAHARRYGSPTILVDGQDVAGTAATEGADCCRVYQHGPQALKGTPPIAQIVEALHRANTYEDNIRKGTES